MLATTTADAIAATGLGGTSGFGPITSSGVPVLQMRVEATGVPLRATVNIGVKTTATDAYGYLGFWMDGAIAGNLMVYNIASPAPYDTQAISFQTQFWPTTAGSHLISAGWSMGGSAAGGDVELDTLAQFELFERLQPLTSNGSV
jgi:hypothetical protein